MPPVAVHEDPECRNPRADRVSLIRGSADPAAKSTRNVRGPLQLVVLASLALAAMAVGVTGAVPLPDLETVLTRFSDSIGTWTYVLVAGLAFLETAAFVGLIAPGETAIVIGGAVAGQGTIELGVLLPLVWLAAALGDLVSFTLGRRLGRPFLARHGRRLGMTPARLDRVDAFFDRHGAKTILIGRFIGFVRAVAPFVAGASGMRLRSFLPWSLLGTAVWATTFTLVGFAFQHSFSAAADTVTRSLLILAAAAIVFLIWRRHRRERLTEAGAAALRLDSDRPR